MLRRVLISVSDKTGIVDFAKKLSELGVEIISTGGTYKMLCENNIPVIKVSDVTKFPEILNGRVKTLHPKIHGGILAVRDNEEHMRELREHGISPIDMVVINLYPFKETILKDNATFEDAIENIDIGGPAMIRASAKNFKDVVIVVDPKDYDMILKELTLNGEISYETRLFLSYKAFSHTAHYDTLISSYLKSHIENHELGDTLTFTFEKVSDLRYGENPHQKAAYYREVGKNIYGIHDIEQLHGKELSFNNINDMNAALELLKEFDKPCAVAIKHANPCGVGIADDIYEAYKKAYDSDPVSIFGGIVALNRKVDKDLASLLNTIFLEIIIAPDFDDDALETLKTKKNLRIMRFNNELLYGYNDNYDIKKVMGGLLVQDKDNIDLYKEMLRVVTHREPTKEEWNDMLFAWKVVKHVKSNAIVIAKDGQTIGIGVGQVSRIDACKIAIEKAGDKTKGAVLASDAFFPFPDVVKSAAEAGITAIIQPGGSVRDEESVREADLNELAMVFTGIRHFKH